MSNLTDEQIAAAVQYLKDVGQNGTATERSVAVTALHLLTATPRVQRDAEPVAQQGKTVAQWLDDPNVPADALFVPADKSVEPVAWKIKTPSGSVIYEDVDPRENYSEEWLDSCESVIPLYAAPLAQRDAERNALVTQLVAALEEARNGLTWYIDMAPKFTDGSDDEALTRIDAALSAAKEEQPYTPSMVQQDLPTHASWKQEGNVVTVTGSVELQPTLDAQVKAAFVKYFGSDHGWLDQVGSWFTEGYKAGLTDANNPPPKR